MKKNIIIPINSNDLDNPRLFISNLNHVFKKHHKTLCLYVHNMLLDNRVVSVINPVTHNELHKLIFKTSIGYLKLNSVSYVENCKVLYKQAEQIESFILLFSKNYPHIKLRKLILSSHSHKIDNCFFKEMLFSCKKHKKSIYWILIHFWVIIILCVACVNLQYIPTTLKRLIHLIPNHLITRNYAELETLTDKINQLYRIYATKLKPSYPFRKGSETIIQANDLISLGHQTSSLNKTIPRYSSISHQLNPDMQRKVMILREHMIKPTLHSNYIIQPYVLNPHFKSMTLRVNKSSLFYAHGPADELNFTWNPDDKTQSFTLIFEDFAGKRTIKEYTGQWTLAKFLDSAKIEKFNAAKTGYLLTFTEQGYVVQFVFKVSNWDLVKYLEQIRE